jgi:hypothetical protein
MSKSPEVTKTILLAKPVKGPVHYVAMLERISKRWPKTLAHLARGDGPRSDVKHSR